jgi:UDPglucose--hexose-1-phosphate uridylyltransferase
VPELRRDPVIGRWVIIATERRRRPSDFGHARENQGSVPCPFCPGNEEKTPPEILAYGHPERGANRPGWWVRVIPNKYPALRIEGQVHRTSDSLYDKMDGLGAHEVIVETEDHGKQLEDLDDSRLQRASNTSSSSRTAAPPPAPAWRTRIPSSSPRPWCPSA